MGEMISYIFGSLDRTETAVKNITKNLVQQNKFNRAVVVFSMVTALHVVVTNKTLKMQQKEIKKLNDEIEKLKESTESES